jgi:adenine phosphoribosyltransferase
VNVNWIDPYIRAIPDHPKPGILFRDITTLLQDGAAFTRAVAELSESSSLLRPTKVAGIEARGFIFGGAVAVKLGLGFVPLRKKGKLPHDTIGHDYELEYGVDRIEMHRDAVQAGDRVLLIDDLIATGGTALAAVALLSSTGAKVIEARFVIGLPGLGGQHRLMEAGVPVKTLIDY